MENKAREKIKRYMENCKKKKKNFNIFKIPFKIQLLLSFTL